MLFPEWLGPEYERLTRLYEQQQLSHGLLIHGPFGTGRRLLALKIADLLLGSEFASADSEIFDENRIDQEQLAMHPDFKLLQLLENEKKPGFFKKDINVEQIRELIEFLTLTSHRGGNKVVMITPAQRMNVAAANSLLKTLEEPARGNYLILITDSLAVLPATIVSRSQQVRVSIPDQAAAEQWLAALQPETDWAPALDISAGAPFAALEWQRINFPKIAAELAADLDNLRQRRDTPAAVAKRWAKYEAEPCLRWLYFRLSAEIRSQICANSLESDEKVENSHLHSAGEVLNIEDDFAVLQQVGRLRRIQGAGLNMELQLAGVLNRWYV